MRILFVPSCIRPTGASRSVSVIVLLIHFLLETYDSTTNYLFNFGNRLCDRLPGWYKEEEKERDHYLLTKLKTVKRADWVKTTLSACSRFIYSDLDFDSEEIHLAKREDHSDISRLN